MSHERSCSFGGLRWVSMVIVSWAGCAPSSERDDRAIAPERRAAVASLVPEVTDLGVVLARGQSIRHEFVLRNPTARPIRLLGARPLTPCCSDLDSIPEVVPGGGSGRIAVRFRPGFQSGRKRVQFAIRTDEAGGTTRIFTLGAVLVAEVEVSGAEGPGLSLPMGQLGWQTLRVTSRRRAGEGRGPAETVSAMAPPATRFLGEPTERIRTDGLIEAVREVELAIAPDPVAGSRSGSVNFGWADGRTWTHVVNWRVTPHITASPSGLVLRPGYPPDRTVALRSASAPFRITGITGPAIAEGKGCPLDVAAQMHLVKLVLDPEGLRSPAPFDVTIATDHADQPQVTISVFVVPETQERGER